jgi:hypothetical protein
LENSIFEDLNTMKIKIISVISGVALLSGLVISPVASASGSVDVAKNLAGSSALELPAKAANLVAKASAAEQKDVAIAVVKTAVGLNPAAAVAIVAAVVRENGTVAPAVAVTAATLQPKRIGMITKAAAVAAPSQAARIVAAMIKEFPRNYGIIAISAADGAPSAGREILAVVADAVPALQASIQAAASHFSANGGNVPVQAILSQSYNQALSSGAVVATQIPATLAPGAPNYDTVVFGGAGGGRLSTTPMTIAQNTPTLASTVPMITVIPSFSPPTVSGPTLGNSFTPISGTPTTYNPSQTTGETTGGRNYSPP